jgi:hypothetical protein
MTPSSTIRRSDARCGARLLHRLPRLDPTHAKRVDRLTAARLHGPDEIARIHAPVGLDIGARDPGRDRGRIMAQITATCAADAVRSGAPDQAEGAILAHSCTCRGPAAQGLQTWRGRDRHPARLGRTEVIVARLDPRRPARRRRRPCHRAGAGARPSGGGAGGAPVGLHGAGQPACHRPGVPELDATGECPERGRSDDHAGHRAALAAPEAGEMVATVKIIAYGVATASVQGGAAEARAGNALQDARPRRRFDPDRDPRMTAKAGHRAIQQRLHGAGVAAAKATWCRMRG